MPGRSNQIRTNDPDGVRNRVLNAAARAFHFNGYGGTSMQDIRRDADVTGGALYHHFPTKKDLALAVIKERVADEVGETWICAVETARTAEEGVLGVFASVIESLEASGKVSGCPLNNLAHELALADDELRSALAEEYARWRTSIARRVSEEQTAGRAAYAPDAEAFANCVVAMFSGAMALAKAEQRTTALKACMSHLESVMGQGRRGRSKSGRAGKPGRARRS